ncbi:MAG: hypothetical protein QXT37_09280 [Thermofilaceae archaeon]
MLRREVLRGKTIYRVVVTPDGVEAIREDRPLGLDHGFFIENAYIVGVNGKTEHYLVNNGTVRRGPVARIDRKRAAEIISEVRQLLAEEKEENVIAAFEKMRNIVKESFKI